MKLKLSTGIVFLTVFLDLLGFGMVLPLMPLYAADPRFLAEPWQIGWLMAIYSIGQFLFAPAWGRISDKWGRRPVMIIGLFGSALSYLAYGLADSLLALFLARAMAGIMGANIATAQAIMADISPPEKRAQSMGLIGAAFGLGFILGPAIGGLLSVYGLEAAPLAAAAVTGLNAVAALFFLGESHTAPGDAEKFSPFRPSHWKRVAHGSSAFAVCLLMGLFITAFAAFEVTLPLYGRDAFDWSMTKVGWIFAYVGVVMVAVQAGLVRRLIPKIGEKKAGGLGLILVALGLSALGGGGSEELVMLGLFPMAVGSGLVHPAFSSLVSLNTLKEHQGLMMGVFQSMSALGRSVGPALGGICYGLLGEELFLWAGAATAAVLLGLLLVSAGLADAPRRPAAELTAP